MTTDAEKCEQYRLALVECVKAFEALAVLADTRDKWVQAMRGQVAASEALKD